MGEKRRAVKGVVGVGMLAIEKDDSLGSRVIDLQLVSRLFSEGITSRAVLPSWETRYRSLNFCCWVIRS